MRAFWSFLIDVTLSSMWNVCDYLISKESFLCIFSHAFCQFVIIIMLALRDVLAETLLFKFYSHHCLGLFFFVHHDLCQGVGLMEGLCFCQATHLPPHVWFQGEFEQGDDCLSFIPLLPDGNQLITHRHRFLDLEQSKFTSCAVGCCAHSCIFKESCWLKSLKKVKRERKRNNYLQSWQWFL